MTVFSDTYDKASPAGGDDPSEADDRMRETKGAIQERENVDHYWPLTGTEVSDADTGEHRKITFHESIANPTPVASHAHFYMKDDELWYQDDTNAAFQLTSGGKLGSAATALLAQTIAVNSAGGNVPASFESEDAGAKLELFDNSTTNNAALGRIANDLTLSPDGGDNLLGTATGSVDRSIADRAYVNSKSEFNGYTAGAVLGETFPLAINNTTDGDDIASVVAATDGFLLCFIAADAVNESIDLEFRTDSANPPTTVRQKVFTKFHDGTKHHNTVCVPVKKGEFIRVVASDNGSASINRTYNWISTGI